MDNEKVINAVINSKLREYHRDEDCDNFVVPHELTVTITLQEYRRLIENYSRHTFEVDEKQRKINSLVLEREQLKKQQEALLRKIAEGNTEEQESQKEEEGEWQQEQ